MPRTHRGGDGEAAGFGVLIDSSCRVLVQEYHMDDWDDYTYKDTLAIEKSYSFFLKCYLQKKGFVFHDEIFSYKNVQCEKKIVIDIIGRYITVCYFYMDDSYVQKPIWLHRYACYPKLLDIDYMLMIPAPSWGYGFVEKLIDTMENFLLDDLINETGLYSEIKSDFESYHKKYLHKPYSIATCQTIEKQKEHLLKMHFDGCNLSLDKYKKRILFPPSFLPGNSR
ncbi:MAG: hypothetical protein LBK74_06035 [Treponema sp.]|nr:hypothetical protein [Treponema sp.]